MIMHSYKRRRIDAANVSASTLSKPFRSPLKVNDALKNKSPDKVVSDTSPVKAKSSSQPDGTSSRAAQKQTASLPSLLRQSTNGNVADDEVTALQKEYAALTQRLRSLRQDLDAAEQAIQIRSLQHEDKLQSSAERWREIARDAAEDVFVAADRRIQDMGGLRAWQQRADLDNALWHESMEEPQSPHDCDHSDEESCELQYAKRYEQNLDNEQEREGQQVGLLLANQILLTIPPSNPST